MRLRHLLLAIAFTATPAAPTAAQDPPIYVGDLAEGRYASMKAMIEKTFLRFDVYEVEVRVGPQTAGAIERLVAGKKHSDELAARVAAVAHRADHAFVRIVFQRDVSMDRFLRGVVDNLDKARDAKMISPRAHRQIVADLPRWFSFLRDRGIKEHEQLLYKIDPDGLRTVYLDIKGRELLDQTTQGRTATRATLAGFFAPGTDERDALIESLFP